MPWRPGPGLGFTTGRPWLPDGERTAADTAGVQRDDPGSHLAAVRRLFAARRTCCPPARPAAAPPCRTSAPASRATGAARSRCWSTSATAPRRRCRLPAPAVFDSDDPAVTPAAPRGGIVSLAPQQALVLRHGLRDIAS